MHFLGQEKGHPYLGSGPVCDTVVSHAVTVAFEPRWSGPLGGRAINLSSLYRLLIKLAVSKLC